MRQVQHGAKRDAHGPQHDDDSSQQAEQAQVLQRKSAPRASRPSVNSGVVVTTALTLAACQFFMAVEKAP